MENDRKEENKRWVMNRYHINGIVRSRGRLTGAGGGNCIWDLNLEIVADDYKIKIG